jgi:uncharacterized protein YbjT (DUF2867 family)
MFVVLGASGNTGKVVAETLLRQKKKVRVVLHDAAKGKAWGEAGADIAIATVDDGPALDVEPVHGEFVNYAAIGIWNRPRQWYRQA